MEELIKFLNSLSQAGREEFERNTQTSINYLRKSASTKRPLGTKLCVRIEAETSGLINRKMLRPHDWHENWPELIAA
ncbi:hypothetical protein AB8Q18_08560 [Neisseriaceae bacterium CLB008]